MPYDREKFQIYNTIRRAGNGSKCTITSAGEPDEITGEGAIEQSFECLFCIESYGNQDNPVHPNFKEDIKILITPLKEDGTEIPNFVEICTSPSATALLPSGEVNGVSRARVTYPDSITPIMARLTLGG